MSSPQHNISEKQGEVLDNKNEEINMANQPSEMESLLAKSIDEPLIEGSVTTVINTEGNEKIQSSNKSPAVPTYILEISDWNVENDNEQTNETQTFGIYYHDMWKEDCHSESSAPENQPAEATDAMSRNGSCGTDNTEHSEIDCIIGENGSDEIWEKENLSKSVVVVEAIPQSEHCSPIIDEADLDDNEKSLNKYDTVPIKEVEEDKLEISENKIEMIKNPMKREDRNGNTEQRENRELNATSEQIDLVEVSSQEYAHNSKFEEPTSKFDNNQMTRKDPSSVSKNEDKDNSHLTENKYRIPADIIRKAKLLAESMGKEIYISYWDMGGQELYYATHHIHLSPDAVYLLVFDMYEMLKNPDESLSKLFNFFYRECY